MLSDTCVFCKIIKADLEAKIEYQDDQVIVIHDISPRAPIHLLIIPKKHELGGINYLADQDKDLLWHMFEVGNNLIKKFTLDKKGFVYRFNGGGYEHIDHLHLWLVGGGKIEPMTDPGDFQGPGAQTIS